MFVRALVAWLCVGVSAAAYAQPERVNATLPVRDLTVSDKAPHLFANIVQVRQIANQQVLVNDGLRRQLILLDGNLAISRVVLDSVSSGERYGPGATPIVPALADSTLFVDRESRVLLVIDPMGKVVRTAAAPIQARDFNHLSVSRSGVDREGNLIFRVPALPTVPKRIGDTTSVIVIREMRPPTHASILRANFETRKTDTVITVRQVSGVRSVLTIDAAGKGKSKVFMNPLETLDDWALLSDGSIAVIRGADYHVDFVRPGGAKESGAKMPFDWKQISEADKQRIIDSTRTAIDEMIARERARGGNVAANFALATALEGMIVNVNGAGTAPTAPPTPVNANAAMQAQPLLEYEIGPLKELPDYYPPMRQGAALGDADGNLWILPATSAQSRAGELVYDFVNNRGQLMQRVRLPVGRSIAGFGRGGVVYLMTKETDGWRLERAKIATERQ